MCRRYPSRRLWSWRPGRRVVCLVALMLAPAASANAQPIHTGSTSAPVSRLELATLDPSIQRRASEALDRAVRLRTAEALGELAVLLHAYERFDLAARCYAEARRLAPSVSRWAYFHGVALAQAGDSQTALRALQEALELEPGLTAARIRLGQTLFDLGHLDESASAYRQALRERPNSALAAYGLGRVLRDLGDVTSTAYLERAVAQAPAFGAALYALAQSYTASGDHDRATGLLQRHREARAFAPPVEDDPVQLISEVRSGPFDDLTQGRDLLRRGRHSEAIALLERAATAKPDLIQAHVNLVAAYAANGDVALAEAAFVRAHALSPELPELHYNLGVLRLAQGAVGDAIDAFREALAGNPLYADAHNNLAYALARRGDVDEAVAHLQKALDVVPTHRDAHFNLARLLQASGAAEEAVTHFTVAATTEDEKTPTYLYYLADAHARLGRPADAERYATQARSRAERLGQTELLARIDEDLRRLRAMMEARR